MKQNGSGGTITAKKNTDTVALRSRSVKIRAAARA